MNSQPDITSLSAAPILNPEDARDLCERLHITASRMSDLLSRETEILKGEHPDEISALQPEKAALSQAYIRDFAALKANARFIGAAAPKQTDQLRRALKLMQAELKRNFTALEATRAVSEGLMNAIFDIARKKRSGPRRYTNEAAMASDRPTAPTALAVDRSL